jgi:hypothetical protein
MTTRGQATVKITRTRVTPHSTLLTWSTHIDEAVSNRLGRRCDWYSAGSVHTFDNGAHGEYRVTQSDDNGGRWTVELHTYKDGTETLSVPFTEQHRHVEEAQAAAQRYEDALHVGVAEFMQQPFSARAELLAHAEQLLADASRHAAVLNLAAASVLILGLSEAITHVHVAVDWEDNLLRIVRFVNAQGAEVDVWDAENTNRFDLIRSILADVLDLTSSSDFLLFTFRDAGEDEDVYGSEKLTVRLFQAS